MKIGACLLLLATPDDPLAQGSISLLAQAGYDYAEVSLARLLGLSDRELAAYQAQFIAARLPVEVFNNANPPGMPLIGPQSDAKSLSLYRTHAIALAQRMGVSLITMSGPNRRTVPDDFSWEQQGFAQYADHLRRFADETAPAGITLAIEPINEEEHSFVSTVDEACRAALASGRNNVKVIADTYHFIKQNDSMSSLEQACAKQIVHLHYAAQERRTYPLAADRSACEAMLKPLLAAGYTGRISIEARTDNAAADLPEACRLVRSIVG